MNKPSDIETPNQPVLGKKRIEELDYYRGFAILGIFMVNILVMNVSFVFRQDWEVEQTGWLNRSTFFVLETVFYSKFFAIFSLLFGVGIALQLQNTLNKSILFFIRRFGALLVFGILHILFIWSGDILHLYAILGFFLLFFFRLQAKYLLWIAILIFLFPYFGQLVDWILSSLSIIPESALVDYSRKDLIELYRNGSYWSGVQLRIKEYIFAAKLVFAYIAPVAFSMMLIGGYLVKKGIVHRLKSFAVEITKPLLIGTAILLVYRFILIYYILPNHAPEWGSMLSITLHTIFQLSDVSISFLLLWTLTLLNHKKYFTKILTPLKYVGRMAFTNYILQSIFGYLIMRTLGYYETFSVFGCFVLVLLFFGIQIIFSKIYFDYFTFGPLEWIWRVISYRKLLPILKENIKYKSLDKETIEKNADRITAPQASAQDLTSEQREI